jgi:16S rRNA (uracil1498-N3)-methyltransferase
MDRFYCQDLSTSFAILDEEESHHLLRVHRKRLGEVVHLFDGNGTIAQGWVYEIGKKEVIIQLSEIAKLEPNPRRVTLAVSPLKSEDRFEWLLEKATEIGVTDFLPILCERTESKRFRKDRYEKIVLGASKQSLKTYVPQIHEPQSLKSGFHSHRNPWYFGHCLESFSSTIMKSIEFIYPVTIAIGPEGDFSESEIRWLMEQGGVPFSLGSERLRTETAAIVALTLSLI